jgi:transcriptional regulator with XRE-family HTH domain
MQVSILCAMGYTKQERLLLRRLGARVRQCRLAMGWSQEDFAFQSELHRNYIGGVERGERNVSALNLIRLAKTLKVSVGDFF